MQPKFLNFYEVMAIIMPNGKGNKWGEVNDDLLEYNHNFNAQGD